MNKKFLVMVVASLMALCLSVLLVFVGSQEYANALRIDAMCPSQEYDPNVALSGSLQTISGIMLFIISIPAFVGSLIKERAKH